MKYVYLHSLYKIYDGVTVKSAREIFSLQKKKTTIRTLNRRIRKIEVQCMKQVKNLYNCTWLCAQNSIAYSLKAS